MYKVWDTVLITNWINRLNSKKLYFKREISTKGNKHQRQERFDIKAYITKIKHQICYAEVKENCKRKGRYWNWPRGKSVLWLHNQNKLFLY